MQSIVGRVLTDRFWQAGISEGSKDEFYARVMEKKTTLEGFASTIRGTVRFVRETCYAIIYCMTRMDVQFYGFSELPGPLAHALFADSFCLSTHQLINLLNLVRYLVDNCPVKLRGHFLPPILAACFQQMDAKINSEWGKLEVQQGVNAEADDLTEEMKAESILRQLTYTAVVMVADFLDPSRLGKSSSSECPRTSILTTCADQPEQEESEDNSVPTEPSLRKFCLMQDTIVAPLLTFCAHAIRMRDTRCCSIVLRVFRSIVPEFHLDNQVPAQPGTNDMRGRPADPNPIPPETVYQIREFISTDVLKACITSLHEAYFVDLQKELAMLIASILVYYSPLTPAPRDVLLSLPNMMDTEVDRTIDYLSRPALHHRQQRAIVLELLKDLKGVSISEMGKLEKSNPSYSNRAGDSGRSKRQSRSKMAQEFMTASENGGTAIGGVTAPARFGPDKPDGATEALDGVAGLFEI